VPVGLDGVGLVLFAQRAMKGETMSTYITDEDDDWLARFGDDWLARYGPATIELFQSFIDNNVFAEFAATPEGARMYAYGERWRAKQSFRPRRAAARKPSPADGLHNASQAAAKLRCSIKTLNGHVASGALGYVIIGHGTKRPRRFFTNSDLNKFIEAQTRKDSPQCPSSVPRARRSGTSTSGTKIIAFTAQPRPGTGAKPKK
jgi:hypothetical protein